jgi:alpha-glucosidase
LRLPKTAKFLACLLPLLAGAAHAQDERRIASPNGQVEFRLFTSVPEGSGLNCLAYQVRLHGQPVIDTSYLGMNIHYQEPLLGENVGLSTDKPLHGTDYNGLWADYLQTSTTGRRIQFEVRVWNDGVAFRYTIPPSPLLMDLLIEDDATEFRFAHTATGERPAHAAIPYTEQDPGVGWVGIYAQEMQGFPRMQLVRSDTRTMSSHLPVKPSDPGVAFEGKTPWTSPWHIIVIGPARDSLANSDILRDLLR